MELINIMEMVTIAVTLLMFSSGIIPCSQMYKTGNTKNVPFHIFLLSAISCSGMLHYGIMKDMTSLVFLNVVGAILNFTYVLTFLAVAPKKGTAFVYLFTGIAYVGSLYYYLYNVIVTQPEVGDVLGQMTSYLTTVIMCVPAIEVISNVRNKNADGMPVVMLVGSIVCSTCWLIYGMMLDDRNIYAPNIPGIMIASAKLFVINMYSSTKEKTV